jgi:ubiquinone/menaquinone biosynthesis C-methylase UbiE
METAMGIPENPTNLRTYRATNVVSHYAGLDYLTPCERFLFDRYLKPGMAILDLGVGGGRTTPYLSTIASRYLGADYSEEMIAVCRAKFPSLEFQVADAADLSSLADGSFDAIVLSYNALDYVLPDEKRQQCLHECRRVLREEGVLIFSSHNPRAVLVRPGWDPARLRAFAREFIPERSLWFPTAVAILTVAKSVHALGRSASGSTRRLFARLPRAFFWRGQGTTWDPADGGLLTHYWSPKLAIAELAQFGFRLRCIQGNDYPRPMRSLVTDWYYYVFSASNPSEGVHTCA